MRNTIRNSANRCIDKIEVQRFHQLPEPKPLHLQVDYILGDNPRATSYMVGYGTNYPSQVHHRASSIVSFKVNPTFVSCRGGYATWFSRKATDPNLLTGAVVGGPDAYDNFADQRNNYEQTEPATYNNAPLLGVLARLSGGHGGYNQLLPGERS